MFMKVWSLPINHKHPDTYCGRIFCNLFHDAVCISIYNTNNPKAFKTRHRLLPNSKWLMSKQYRYTLPAHTVHATIAPQYHMQISYTGFQPHWTTNTAVRIEIHLHLSVKCGFRCSDFHELHNHSIQLYTSPVLKCIQIRRKSTKCWQNFIYVLKQSTAFSAPICKSHDHLMALSGDLPCCISSKLVTKCGRYDQIFI
jgi:hypothetical protein